MAHDRIETLQPTNQISLRYIQNINLKDYAYHNENGLLEL